MYVREESPSRARLVKNRIVDCSTTDGDDVENLATQKEKGSEFSAPRAFTMFCYSELWPSVSNLTQLLGRPTT